MKIITVPTHTEWESGYVKEGVVVRSMKMTDFQEFCIDAIKGTASFGSSPENIHSYIKIKKELKKITMDTKEIRLEDADWKQLKDAVEGMKWHPEYAASCMEAGYFDAIKNAQSVDIATGK